MKYKIPEEAKTSFTQLSTSCFYQAWDLVSLVTRTEEQNLEMLDCAHTAFLLDVRTSSGNSTGGAYACLLSECYLAVGSIDLAQAYANRSILIHQQDLRNPMPLALDYSLLSRIFCASNRLDLALDAIEQGMSKLDQVPTRPADFKPFLIPTFRNRTGEVVSEEEKDESWKRVLAGVADEQEKCKKLLQELRETILRGEPEIYPFQRANRVSSNDVALDGTVEQPKPVRFIKPAYGANHEMILAKGLDISGTVLSMSRRPNTADLEHEIFTITYSFNVLGETVHDEIEFSVNTHHIERGLAGRDLDEFEESLGPGEIVYLKVQPTAPFQNVIHFSKVADEVLQHEAVWM